MARCGALKITIVNGDLVYNDAPLLIGHYRASKLSGAEGVVDRAIGGAMSDALQRGLYPLDPGSHQILLNTHQNTQNPFQPPRPAAVIVAGLGPEGELRGTGLVSTVRQAVIAWAQRLMEQDDIPQLFTLATTLLGSGGVGVSASQAAPLIAQGIREANEQLASGQPQKRWPQVEELRIIELYLDRAADAWRALQTLAGGAPRLYEVAPRIKEGMGAIRRPPEGSYRGADYDFVSALVQQSADQGEMIVYTVDTKRARSEVRAEAAQLALIRSLVLSASNTYCADDQIGRTLFSLLVPVDLEPFLASSTATVIEVDSGTAGIPWELLDSRLPGGGETRPWAIRTKLLRKLRTTVASPIVHDASAVDRVLVIGDPDCDRSTYPKLPAARQEAADVVACFNGDSQVDGAGPGAPAAALISPLDLAGIDPDAGDVIKGVMGTDWRIIHIAAHGEPPITVDGRINPRGVVLSNGTFLGPREIASLRVVPELVFVNCCYLARPDDSLFLTETKYDRATFAAGLAEALIRGGVRCVIAAGWAVDDAAARTFATTFYKRLLDGATFCQAVAAAREETLGLGGTTWAAYQCYGDPDWTFRRAPADGQTSHAPDSFQELGGIASETAFLIALDTLAVKSEIPSGNVGVYVDRLRFLESTYAPVWGERGRVAEAFGNAWAKLNRLDEAIAWYGRAQRASDGSVSLKALEQLANVKARRAWEQLLTAPPDASSLVKARSEVSEAMSLLESVLAFGSTYERESIYGSAYKRLAMIESIAGPAREQQEIEALHEMKGRFAKALSAAERDGSTAMFYSAMNVLAAELALFGRIPSASISISVDVVRASMYNATPDFWSVVGQTEIDMYAAIVAGTLAQAHAALTKQFVDHHTKVPAPNRWASVYDNATLVLAAYQRHAKGAEADAARSILRFLSGLAAR